MHIVVWGPVGDGGDLWFWNFAGMGKSKAFHSRAEAIRSAKAFVRAVFKVVVTKQFKPDPPRFKQSTVEGDLHITWY